MRRCRGSDAGASRNPQSPKDGGARRGGRRFDAPRGSPPSSVLQQRRGEEGDQGVIERRGEPEEESYAGKRDDDKTLTVSVFARRKPL